jgi:hypothetical protein
MAIDAVRETLITFREATRSLPRRRGGHPTNLSTLYRWRQMGCRGVRLEFTMVGATRCTSREALQRFFDRLTEAAESRQAGPVPQRTQFTKSRECQIEAAEQRLAHRGI